MALVICTWLWGDKYGADDVAKLAAGIRRNLREPYRFLAITDRDIEIAGVDSYAIPQQDRGLLGVKGCFARLRMFDPAWQKATQIRGRLVCMDLDSVVTSSLDGLFDRDEPFVILQGVNASNPCPYNGSLWMLHAGYRPDVWSDFSIDAAAKIANFVFADDQGWFADKMPDAAAFTPKGGVYAFKKPGWPKGDDLPANARIVAFPGWRSPEKFKDLPWVKQNWKM